MDALNQTINNATNLTDSKNETLPETPEGLFCAYSGLFIMALLPIYFGSIKSVVTMKSKRESGEEVDTISNKDAYMFPFIASGALFGIYLFFKIFSKEYINMLLAVYFFFIGVASLSKTFSPVVHKILPSCFPNVSYKLLMTRETDEPITEESIKKNEIFELKYDRKDLVSLAIATVVGLWYIISKNWIANNLFGLAFSVNGIELLQLNKVGTGCILLGGLFIYDIFWVFGTNVMVTVAKSFEAPIKLVFPRDIISQGIFAKNFAMLGLGDIVIPGIFIALLLRFDNSLNRGSRTYFHTGFFAYIVGLSLTMVVMHVFKHAQPALLYLVPTCLGFPILLALIKGDIKAMFSYEDSPETDEKSKTEEKKAK